MAVAVTKRNKTPWQRIKASWQLYVLVAPALVYLILFHYLPIYGIQIAFKNYTARGGILGSEWVGFKHFIFFFKSPQFETLLRNTLLLSIYSLLWGFPAPIMLALMVNEIQRPGVKRFVQNITYAPHFISTVVMVSMIQIFFTQGSGIVNQFIEKLGGESINFLGKDKYFRTIYIATGIWQDIGWSSVLYISALSGVDPQLHEAAEIDGASRLQRLWHINLPGIRGTVVIMFILSCGSVMSVGYEKVYLMQNATNLQLSEVISTYVYKTGLLNVKYSYTAAIGLFNNVVNVIILLIANTLAKRLGDISLF